jgi:hypothetical protein
VQTILKDDSEYIKKLQEIFDLAEDLKNYEQLSTMYIVIKSMLSLGDQKLIENLFSDQFYLFAFGALEYDPELFGFSEQDIYNGSIGTFVGGVGALS